MKAFRFRLEPALRWRSTLLRVEMENLARKAAHLAALQSELDGKHSELRAGAAELVAAGSAAFESWAAYVSRCRSRIRFLDDQLRQARKALALQTQKLAEAHRGVRVLEELRRDAHSAWTREVGREEEGFAGEAFLAKLSRNSRGAGASRPRGSG